MTPAFLAVLLAVAPARAQEPPAAPPPVLTGIDVLAERGFADIKGKRVGLITNQTGRDTKGRATFQILANASDVTLSALFSPEHGFIGVVDDTAVASGSFALPDGRTVPLYSLYGSTRAPTPAMLAGLDVLVFDIQDIGARFYTYATTMAMALEAAAKADLDFMVLDRPNPINGDTVEGPVLEDGLRNFMAYLPVPVRHGLTMGELARLHTLTAGLGAKLTIVPLKGWRRSMWYDQTGLPWTRPSPNMPDLDAATLYPGIACFEAANVSVGRGTERPFRWVGAPWMDAAAVVKRLRSEDIPGVEFSVEKATPTKSVYEGVVSNGVRMRVTDREALRPLRVWVHLAAALRDIHPKEFKVDADRLPLFVGTKGFVERFLAGAPVSELETAVDEGLAGFKARRAAFLLY